MAKDQKDLVVNVRVSQEEHEIIKAKADRLAMSVSSFLRMVALNVDVQLKLTDTK